MRSACSTSSARDNVHGGRWWTLGGHRSERSRPGETTEPQAKQPKVRSPLPDSNRRPPPYHRVHARSLATHFLLQIGLLQAVKMRRETTRVSFLMCPFCVRDWMSIRTTRRRRLGSAPDKGANEIGRHAVCGLEP